MSPKSSICIHLTNRPAKKGTDCLLPLCLFRSKKPYNMGRGSAVAMVLVLCLVALQYEVAQAAVYTVGGAGGWTFNVASWPRGKRFRAGDILVFKYTPQSHNVVAVNNGAYDSCSTPRGAKVYTSGNDRIMLAKGQNSFICNYPGHCQSNMKITVNAF